MAPLPERTPFSVRVRLASPLIATCLFLVAMGLSSAGEDEAPFYLFKDGAPIAAIALPAGALDDPRERMSSVEPYRVVPANVPSDLARALDEFRRDLRVGYGIDLPVVFLPATDTPQPDTRFLAATLLRTAAGDDAGNMAADAVFATADPE